MRRRDDVAYIADLSPSGIVAYRTRAAVATLDRDFRGVIAGEEARVDFNTGDRGCENAQAEDDEVGRGGVVATGLPAVVPCAFVGEGVGFVNRGVRRGEVGGGAEELVGGAEDARAQVGVEEVCIVALERKSRVGG